MPRTGDTRVPALVARVSLVERHDVVVDNYDARHETVQRLDSRSIERGGGPIEAEEPAKGDERRRGQHDLLTAVCGERVGGSCPPVFLDLAFIDDVERRSMAQHLERLVAAARVEELAPGRFVRAA